MKKTKYVQLEPGAALLDWDTQHWSAKEFGCYWRIILQLYSSGGRLPFGR